MLDSRCYIDASRDAAARDALGRTLATLREREGMQLSQVPRSFAFDVLLAYWCRASGLVLVTGNARDMARISRVFTFKYVAPIPRPRKATGAA